MLRCEELSGNPAVGRPGTELHTAPLLGAHSACEGRAQELHTLHLFHQHLVIDVSTPQGSQAPLR